MASAPIAYTVVSDGSYTLYPVSGPGGLTQLARLISVTPAGNGTPRTATYQITAPGGAWDSVVSTKLPLPLVCSFVLKSLIPNRHCDHR